MATHHARPSKLIDIGPLGNALGDTKTGTLLKLFDQSKQQILLDFKHELRNLCAAMQNATDVIRLDTCLSKDSFEMLAILDRQLIRLAKAVTGFSDQTGELETTDAKHNRVGKNETKETQNAFRD